MLPVQDRDRKKRRSLFFTNRVFSATKTRSRPSRPALARTTSLETQSRVNRPQLTQLGRPVNTNPPPVNTTCVNWDARNGHRRKLNPPNRLRLPPGEGCDVRNTTLTRFPVLPRQSFAVLPPPGGPVFQAGGTLALPRPPRFPCLPKSAEYPRLPSGVQKLRHFDFSRDFQGFPQFRWQPSSTRS